MFSSCYTSQNVYGLRTFTKFSTIRSYTAYIFRHGASVVFHVCQEFSHRGHSVTDTCKLSAVNYGGPDGWSVVSG